MTETTKQPTDLNNPTNPTNLTQPDPVLDEWLVVFDAEYWNDSIVDEMNTRDGVVKALESLTTEDLINQYLESTDTTLFEFIGQGALITYYTGKVAPYLPTVLASDVLDNVIDRAYDVLGEHAETYLERVTSEQDKDLTETLTNAFRDWATRNKQEPNFYAIVEVKEHNIDLSADPILEVLRKKNPEQFNHQAPSEAQSDESLYDLIGDGK